MDATSHFLVPHIFETAPSEPSDPTTSAIIPTHKNTITGISGANPPMKLPAIVETSDRKRNKTPTIFRAIRCDFL